MINKIYIHFIQRLFAVAAAVMLIALTSHATLLQDTRDFIDGFPDIPRLAIVTDIIGEPVVFDTASGTVAEVELKISTSLGEAFSAYGLALKQLGWSCRQGPSRLACSRGDSVVSMAPSEGENNDETMILRLEPRH